MSRELSERLPKEIDLRKEMGEILNRDIVNRHSFFQLKYFVVGKEHTTQSQLWCCIRELQARKQSMDHMRREIEELKDNLELLAIEIERQEEREKQAESVLDKKEAVIQQRKLNRRGDALRASIQDVQDKLKNTEEEAAFLAVAFRQLEEKESLKPYDDLRSQTEMWNAKLTEEFNLRMLTGLPLDVELMKTILALKDDVPIKKQTVHILQQTSLQPALGDQTAKNALPDKDRPGIAVKEKDADI